MTTPTDESPEGIDPREFRRVVGHLASGVTVVTTQLDGVRYGMTASSVTSLSSDPPMMLACLNNAVPTSGAVATSMRYAINVLSESHGRLAHQFAVPSDDKFAGVQVTSGELDLPLISDALATIECVVSEKVVGGTHSVFFGDVVSAKTGSGQPLTYYKGGFGRFEFARDDQIYRTARQKVLDRDYASGDVIPLLELAGALEVDESGAFYALTRLAADGLVRRDPALGYVVTPFDLRTSDSTFDARLIIELGVIDQIVGRVPPARLSALREHFEQMAALLVDDRFVDFDAYLDANYLFHQTLVELAENVVLTATFGSLAIKQVMTKSFGSTPVTSQSFIDAQRGIIEGLEAGDGTAAKAAAAQYTDLAKRRAMEIIELRGGQL
ncbi:flavin reductase [Allobranchiibius sp. GilTou38]|uniref:flavin reductase n=1 Tax=Allobranchiibius sp. GilTou38 TaxID=2815210 RepID=UPI001AA1035C|nr:flavin reductase [Allobranchiibius sp. GilTou38]MBO1766739.1 flavin reductase [Allobranchiibius sp. GilTou38]